MPEHEVKRKLAAIFSADAKDYSRLMHDDEAQTVQTISQYREIMTSLIHQHRGRLVDSPGDNLLADFPSVVDAVQGAVAIQRELKARNSSLPPSRRMEFRIGINLGDVIDEGDRIYGDGVNIAARLEGLAEPGGICVSRTAYDQIEDKLPLGYEYLGEQNVKNIVKPIRAYKVLLEPQDASHKAEEDETIGFITRDQRRAARLKMKEARHKEIFSKIEKVHQRAAKLKRREVKRQLKQSNAATPEQQKNGGGQKAVTDPFFRKHLTVYAGIIGFLLIINIFAWHGHLWFLWPALGWGLFLFLHWFRTRTWGGLADKNHPRYRFIRHLGTYAAVIVFLMIINLLSWRGHLWFHWPALAWGLLLFLHWVRISGHST